MITVTLTADIVTGLTWNGGTNRSDAWASQVQDGGEMTHYLGDPVTETEKTCLATVSGPVKVHMGTWITPLAPEVLDIKSGSSFNFNALCGYESAGTLNAYTYYKISVVVESAGVLTYNRTIIDWTAIQSAGAPLELGSSIASDLPYGGALGASSGLANPVYVGAAETLTTSERLVLEIGIDVTAAKTGTVAIEHGNHANHDDVYTSLVGLPGGGRFGSEIGIPVHPSGPNDWGGHQELSIPIVSGTNVIPWADVGTDWSTAKWVDTGASRIVQRLSGIVVNQVWCFQDDDYLYLAMNNPTDGCIQSSDHAEIFICAGSNWQGSGIPDNDDWTFRRDITAGTSATRAPTLPVAQGDGLDAGEYILQGDNGPGYPVGLEVPTYNAGAKTFTFASNGKVFTEGTDFRMGGPGATTTAPNPDGSPTGAYSEFKIRKAHLNGWTGLTAAGIMLLSQCDVQGQGTTMYPEILGRRIDKNDWPWCGAIYTTADGVTASSKTTADPMDLRPWNAMHAHAPDTGVSFNASATATVDTAEAAISNQNAFQPSASTSVDTTEAAISNANAFEATASATVDATEAAITFMQAFEATASATVDTTEAAISNSNIFSTNVSQFDDLDTRDGGWTQDSFDTYTASGAIPSNAYDSTVPTSTGESYYTVYEILSSNNLGALEFSAGGGTPVVAPSVAVGIHIVRGIIGGALTFVGQEMYFDGTWNGQIKIHSYGLDANFGLDSTIDATEAPLDTAGERAFEATASAAVDSTEAALDGSYTFEATASATADTTEAAISNENAFEATTSATADTTEAAISNENAFEATTSATVDASEAPLATQGQIDFEATSATSVDTTEAAISNENAFEATASATADSTEAAISNQNAFEATSATSVDTTEAAISNENAFEATASATADTTEAAISNENLFKTLGAAPGTTSLLAHFDGTEGSTDFLDESIYGHTITPINVTVDTDIKKFGTGSMLLGSASYLSIPDHESFDFGTGDYAIDFQVYIPSTYNGPYSIAYTKGSGAAWLQVYFSFPTLAETRFYVLHNGSSASDHSIFAEFVTVPRNQWHHFEVSRTDGVIRVFQNGIHVLTGDASGALNSDSNTEVRIGRDATTTSSPSVQYDEYRVQKGPGVGHVTDFTAPTEAYVLSSGLAAEVDTTEAVVINENAFEATASATADSTEALITSLTEFETTVNATVSVTEANLATQGAVEFATSITTSVDATEVAISNENLYEVTSTTSVDSTEALLDGLFTFEASSTTSVDTTEAAISNENAFEATASATVDSTEATVDGSYTFEATSDTSVDATEASITTTAQLDFAVSASATADTTEAAISNENAFEATSDTTVDATEASITTTGQIDFAVSATATVDATEASITTTAQLDFAVSATATADSTESAIINIISYGPASNSSVSATEATILSDNAFYANVPAEVTASEANLATAGTVEFASFISAGVDSTEVGIINVISYGPAAASSVQTAEATVSNENAFSTSSPATVTATDFDLLIELLYILRNPDGSYGGELKKPDGSPGGIIKRFSGGSWIDT